MMIKKNNNIKQILFYKKLPIYLWWNMFTFVAAYVALLGMIFAESFTQWKLIAVLVVTAILHVVSLLASFWNFNIRCFFQYAKVKTQQNLQDQLNDPKLVVMVVPNEHKGELELCPILRTSTQSSGKPYFVYQRRKYLFNKDTNVFEKPPFPIHETIGFYQKRATGIATQEELNKLRQEYERNIFDIPLPAFMDLFKEHALAPFFVFQVACVGLWCLDEYWYYSVMTLVMLFMFESTVVNSRLRNLKQVRQMASLPQPIYVLRQKKWEKLMSDQLLPFDVVSLTKQSEDVVCPCDMLLLSGKCVTNEALLTGESTPQMKDSIEDRTGQESDNEVLDIKKKDKRHIIFGGTRVLQHHASRIHSPPDQGSVAMVLKTGFETNQGKLIRTILFSSTARVSAGNVEAYFFILFLLIFALIAAGYVLYQGLLDPNKSRYKLFLNCVLIITSVVPPELPMELSLAVNNSLLSLSKMNIFCTEPFRIPFGGRINVCCFDKTGTLTSDKMFLKGIANVSASSKNTALLSRADDIYQHAIDASTILGGCHSLIMLDNETIGDPMEKAALNGIGFAIHQNGDQIEAFPKENKKAHTIRILKRFAFDSDLKRMSTIVVINNKDFFGLMKGAPEVIKSRLDPSTVPANYDQILQDYANKGGRVIALGFKRLNSKEKSQVITDYQDRSSVECDMQFAGFAIFDSDMKPKTKETIQALLDSAHKTIMITGDNVLTAVHVARELNIMSKQEKLILSIHDNKPVFMKNDNSIIEYEQANMKELSNTYDFAASGDAMAKVRSEWLQQMVPYFAVFARVSPEQKQFIITAYKQADQYTLMCGDGTNDVGALKQAHAGVALLDDKTSERLTQIQQQKQSALQQAQQRKKTITEMIKEQQELEEQSNLVRLGDASIASPFTSKISNIEACSHIIRQGRCTLVTTLQMFKILALNCLISAYSLSVLYLDGIKFSDTQMFMTGIGVAVCFLFISRSQPLDKLSKERPYTTIFNAYHILSIMGQFAIHLTTLFITVQAAKLISPSENLWIKVLADEMSVEPELVQATSTVIASDPSIIPVVTSKFQPNVINSIVFIVTSLQTVVTFANNYKGHPFMQSLTENRGLLVVLSGLGAVCIVGASNLVPELNTAVDLVMIPTQHGFHYFFVGLLLLNVISVLGYEKLLTKLFKEE